ncbi:alpha-L-fucosidase-like [Procambarus clarkii]|uniref:alpha-L-fucosidase-like n=1 Tax=Procambarus clarkii TaxID=6728 RepID=UPI003743A90E
MEERLRQLGSWLDINGDAVYDSTPWTHQNDSVTPGVWFTSKGETVYVLVLSWPRGNLLTLGSVLPTPETSISILGYHDNDIRRNLQFKFVKKGMQVVFPPMSDMSSQWAWVLAMSKVKPVKQTFPRQLSCPGSPPLKALPKEIQQNQNRFIPNSTPVKLLQHNYKV